jgi:hypothetical protein
MLMFFEIVKDCGLIDPVKSPPHEEKMYPELAVAVTVTESPRL